MSTALSLLLIAAGLVVSFIPLMTELTTHPNNLIMITTGVTLIGLGIFINNRKVSKNNRQRKLAVDLRIAELTRHPWNSHQTLEANEPFNGMSRMILITLLALPGIAAAGYSLIPLWFLATSLSLTNTNFNWESLSYLATLCLGSAFVAILLLFFVARNMAYVGNPFLTLNTQGFTHPIHGSIAWKHVTGTFLQDGEYRGERFFILHFRIDDYDSVSSPHFTERWLGRLRLGGQRDNIIRLAIDGLSEPPEVIGAIAQFLWKQATGIDYPWSPNVSDAVNAASRRIHEHIKRSKDKAFMDDILESTPGYLLDVMKQMDEDLGTIKSERDRRRVRLYWVVALFFVCTIASAVIRIWLNS